MNKKAMSAEDMSVQLIQDRGRKQYNELSAEIKEQSLKKDLALQAEILNTVWKRGKVNLEHFEEVVMQTQEYLNACEKSNSIPQFQQLCSAFGLTRQDVYIWMSRHPATDTTRFLKSVQTSFSSILTSQALQKNTSEALTIFLLKNSHTGFSDNPISYGERTDDPLGERVDPAAIAEKYADFPD